MTGDKTDEELVKALADADDRIDELRTALALSVQATAELRAKLRSEKTNLDTILEERRKHHER